MTRFTYLAATVALAGACASDPDAADPIGGLVDDCDASVRRELFSLGLPVSGRLGSATSFYDPRTLPAGGPGFYPLALDVRDGVRTHRASSSPSGPDARCKQLEDVFLTGVIQSTALDPEKFPLARGEIEVSLDLRFDDVAFPQSAAEVQVAFDPKTRAAIAVSAQTIAPTRASLVVRHLAPLPDTSTAIVRRQELPLAFACEVGFPLTSSWQPWSLGGRDDGPLCARNDAGERYCLVYELRHGGGDCRFATESGELTTIDGASIAVDFAGSLDRIVESGQITGIALEVDTVQLR
jgi:hypothetical protein